MILLPDTMHWIRWLMAGRLPEVSDPGARRRILLATPVLQELWAGVGNPREATDLERLYDAARRRGVLVNPPSVAWVLAGQAIARLRARRRLGPARLRALRNDVLLAVTAALHGATVLTANRRDFAMIREVVAFSFR